MVCRPALKKLFSSIACIDHLLDKNEFDNADIYGMDYWMFLLSLPGCFNTKIDTIPNQLPYLSSPQIEREKWKHKLPNSDNNSFNIGLVWKGGSVHKDDVRRSLPSIKTLKPLWQVATHINFISLQKGTGEYGAKNPPIDQPLTHLGADIQDFSDTAAIVSQLDLVICVDTAIAHLAGSLNIPCWILLPDRIADWRWMLDRKDSPWYPNARLFRQITEGEWDETIVRIADALRQKERLKT